MGTAHGDVHVNYATDRGVVFLHAADLYSRDHDDWIERIGFINVVVPPGNGLCPT